MRTVERSIKTRSYYSSGGRPCIMVSWRWKAIGRSQCYFSPDTHNNIQIDIDNWNITDEILAYSRCGLINRKRLLIKRKPRLRDKDFPKRNFAENGPAIYTVNSLRAKLLFVLNQSGRRHMVPRRGPGNSRKRSREKLPPDNLSGRRSGKTRINKRNKIK